MTDIEANRIIDDVIKAHWPTWEFSQEETRVWLRELGKYDFSRARTMIGEFYMRRTRQGKPAPGNLLAAMRKSLIPRNTENEPLHVYEIVKMGNKRGYRFAMNRKDLPPSTQEMEETAEKSRLEIIEMNPNEQWIILRKWKQYYPE